MKRRRRIVEGEVRVHGTSEQAPDREPRPPPVLETPPHRACFELEINPDPGGVRLPDALVTRKHACCVAVRHSNQVHAAVRGERIVRPGSRIDLEQQVPSAPPVALELKLRESDVTLPFEEAHRRGGKLRYVCGNAARRPTQPGRVPVDGFPGKHPGHLVSGIHVHAAERVIGVVTLDHLLNHEIVPLTAKAFCERFKLRPGAEQRDLRQPPLGHLPWRAGLDDAREWNVAPCARRGHRLGQQPGAGRVKPVTASHAQDIVLVHELRQELRIREIIPEDPEQLVPFPGKQLHLGVARRKEDRSVAQLFPEREESRHEGSLILFHRRQSPRLAKAGVPADLVRFGVDTDGGNTAPPERPYHAESVHAEPQYYGMRFSHGDRRYGLSRAASHPKGRDLASPAARVFCEEVL